jgi:hypothetical protein
MTYMTDDRGAAASPAQSMQQQHSYYCLASLQKNLKTAN